MSGITKKNIDQAIKFVYSDNNSLSVIFHDNDLLMGVVGEFNNNLKELEKITNTSIYSRGNSILIKSTPKKNEIVKNAIVFLFDQFINNGAIEKKDIISSVNKFMIEEKNDKIHSLPWENAEKIKKMSKRENFSAHKSL